METNSTCQPGLYPLRESMLAEFFSPRIIQQNQCLRKVEHHIEMNLEFLRAQFLQQIVSPGSPHLSSILRHLSAAAICLDSDALTERDVFR